MSISVAQTIWALWLGVETKIRQRPATGQQPFNTHVSKERNRLPVMATPVGVGRGLPGIEGGHCSFDTYRGSRQRTSEPEDDRSNLVTWHPYRISAA